VYHTRNRMQTPQIKIREESSAEAVIRGGNYPFRGLHTFVTLEIVQNTHIASVAAVC
jgi:hypothetical protein